MTVQILIDCLNLTLGPLAGNTVALSFTTSGGVPPNMTKMGSRHEYFEFVAIDRIARISGALGSGEPPG